MSERFAGPASHQAWTELDGAQYDVLWDRFNHRFGFRAGVDPSSWPAITEPTPSLTFDLSVIPDGPRRGAAFDAINADVLRAFVWSLPDVPELIALDWFLSPDFNHGTFGHPWEQTLGVMGEPLIASLGRTLGTWLPVRRSRLPPG